MNRLLLFAVALCCLSASAQKFSFGPIGGVNFYNDQNSTTGPNESFFDSGSVAFANVTFGAYGEYQIATHTGAKLEAVLNKQEFVKGRSNMSLNELYKFSFVDVNASFKYDFGEYRKGFYLQIGPKVAFMTKAQLEGKDVKSEYKTVHLGATFAFGTRVLKYVDLQTKGDYGLTPFFKDQYSPSKIFNVYVTAQVDIARIIYGS